MRFTNIAALALSATLSNTQEITPLPSTCKIPSTAAYPKSSPLPNPFLQTDGTRLTTHEAWQCKRAEIRDQVQRYELGTKPAKPASVTAYMSGNSINITCAEGGRSVSFSVSVQKPSSGAGPHPAVVAFGFASVPVPMGVAVVTYDNQQIAADLPRGSGRFFDLYRGTAHEGTGGLMAWAWGVSRIIDALELLGAEKTGIDPKRVAVTGCSRNGKGALIAGAFDDRIALTIPQEGGSGGPGCWRIAADMKRKGINVEDAPQIVTGDQWFAETFTNYVQDVTALPYDHHMIEALVAPRALLVIENSGIDYLGPVSTYGCSVAGRAVFEALGVKDNMGFSQVSHGSSHCQLPGSQNVEVAAFFGRFLLGRADADTDVMKTDGNFNFVRGDWIPWTVPSLS